MDTLDYQQQCSLIRYPFKDNATLLWTNDANTGQLPTSIILDAIVTIGDGTTFQPSLNTILFDGTSWVFQFSHSFNIDIISTNNITTFSNRVGANLLRIDIDTSALVRYFTSLALTGTFTFDSSCKLCVSSIKLLSPKVTEIILKNTSQLNWMDGPTALTELDITTGSINFEEGFNTNFSANGQVVTIDILPGNGLGLLDTCVDNTAQVLTINNTGPNTFGNYFLNNDNCFDITAATNALSIDNNCLPDCKSSDITNLAHYSNRITDATIQLQNYLNNAESLYNNLLTVYNTSNASRSPYIIAQSTAQSNKVYNFLNITCGVYNPGNGSISAKLDVLFSTGYTIVPGTTYIIQNNVRTILSDPILIDGVAVILNHKTVSCSSVSYVGFVLKSPIVKTNLGNSIFDISFNLYTISNSVDTLVSNYVLSLNPISFNFNVTNTVSINSGHKFVKIDLDLQDPKQPASSATSINIEIPGYFEISSSTLNANGVITNLNGAGFNVISLDYTKSNHYQLLLSCPINITGTKTININGDNTSGSSNKTITFTL